MNGLFCEIIEGVCFTTSTKLDPEECRASCEMNNMHIPSFYQLEGVSCKYKWYNLIIGIDIWIMNFDFVKRHKVQNGYESLCEME